jgi:alkylhydroperoxidase family enzyme
MPWIQQIPKEKANGLLKRQFDAAIKRAGRVWHIVHIMSLNPAVLRDSIKLYSQLMLGSSPLSRIQREMQAVVVAIECGCHY